jgi:hypothetical protein
MTFFYKKKYKKMKKSKKNNDYMKKRLKYEFELYKKGIRYNYCKNLLELSKY